MRNTKAIVEAICNHTSFDPSIKNGLLFLKESNVDIVHWNALNEQEEGVLANPESIVGAFNRFSSTVSGPLGKETKRPPFTDWVKTTPLVDTSLFKDPKKQSEITAANVEADKKKYFTKDEWAKRVQYLDREQSTEAERIIADKKAAENTYIDVLAKTENIVGKENIKTYIEKISDDVQTFVALVTFLTDQIVKEAWVNAPQTIQKVFGNRLYFLEQPALAIRGKNVSAFNKEASTVLKLAYDLSTYFVLQNANQDIEKSVEDSWPEAQKMAKEILDKIKIPEPVKTMFAFNETSTSNFLSELTDAVWESIPALIEEHGDDFFLIIESQDIMPIHDAFNSSRFQAYHPLFESMYYQLKDRKPFNWLLELETYLVDDKEINKNLTYCATTLVKQQIAKNGDFLFPIVGTIAGFTAHQLVKTAYKTEDGLSELLGVKDALWITSGYVPGTFGLVLLLFNVASAVLFLAYAEDIVGLNLDKTNPDMAELPIWTSFKDSAFDLKVEYEQKRKQEKLDQKTSTASPKSAVRTGIKIK